MIPHSRTILTSAASNQYYAMLLNIMSLATYICRDHTPCAQSYTRSFTFCRVGLFRLRDAHFEADAFQMWTFFGAEGWTGGVSRPLLFAASLFRIRVSWEQWGEERDNEAMKTYPHYLHERCLNSSGTGEGADGGIGGPVCDYFRRGYLYWPPNGRHQKAGKHRDRHCRCCCVWRHLSQNCALLGTIIRKLFSHQRAPPMNVIRFPFTEAVNQPPTSKLSTTSHLQSTATTHNGVPHNMHAQYPAYCSSPTLYPRPQHDVHPPTSQCHCSTHQLIRKPVPGHGRRRIEQDP